MKQEIVGLMPFDIEAAKTGAEVVTKEGAPVEILEYELRGCDPIVGVIHSKNIDIVERFTAEGKNKHDVYDLYLQQVKCSGWINVVFSAGEKRIIDEVVYDTPEEAQESRLLTIGCNNYNRLIATIPISWLEIKGEIK